MKITKQIHQKLHVKTICTNRKLYERVYNGYTNSLGRELNNDVKNWLVKILPHENIITSHQKL